MMDKKYKPRAGFWALGGIITFAIGFVLYATTELSRDNITLLTGGSFLIGVGLAIAMISLIIYRLEGQILRQEKRIA